MLNCQEGSLTQEAFITQVRTLYIEFTKKYFKIITRFMSNKNNKQKYDKQRNMLLKFIEICESADVSFEMYMFAQFEQLAKFFKSKGMHFIPFNALVSDKAVQRFYKWKRTTSAKYEKEEERKNALRDFGAPQWKQSMFDSAKALLKRLVVLTNISDEIVIKEIEMLHRLGALRDIYVYSHGLVAEKGSPYLLKVCEKIQESLDKDDLKIISKIRDQLNDTYLANLPLEICEYV